MSHVPHFMGDYSVAYSLHRKEADVRNCVFETTESPLAQLDTYWRLSGCQATGSNKCLVWYGRGEKQASSEYLHRLP